MEKSLHAVRGGGRGPGAMRGGKVATEIVWERDILSTEESSSRGDWKTLKGLKESKKGGGS